MPTMTEACHRRAAPSVFFLRHPRASQKMQLAHRIVLSRLFVACATMVALFPVVVHAQSTQPDSSVWTLPVPAVSLPFLPTPAGLWTVTLGAGGNFRPEFEGSTHYLLSPIPIINVQRAGSGQQPFISPRDGASIALFDAGGFRAGPVGTFLPSRKASSDPALSKWPL